MFQPPAVLKPSDSQTEQEAMEIAITKLLLKSYYDIVRKNIEDSVPKAIMHFLVSFLASFPCRLWFYVQQSIQWLLICLPFLVQVIG